MPVNLTGAALARARWRNLIFFSDDTEVVVKLHPDKLARIGQK